MLAACDQMPVGQQVVNKAIATHGGEHYQHADIKFDFRDRHYKILLDGGNYQYESWFTDSTGSVHDLLNNNHYKREINNEWLNLSDQDSAKYANSLNSVAYFALLPEPLEDAAVVKKYLGEVTLEGQPYHKVFVSFKEEQGGKDFEDIFVYWFHKETYQMDYLAYLYHTDEGGTRFRKAINPRDVNNIHFADYINYEGPYPIDSINHFDQLFEQGKLEELSRIELRNIEVQSASTEKLN